MLNKPTRFKIPDKSSCIDLIMTHCPRNFKNSCAIETGLVTNHFVIMILGKNYGKWYPKEETAIQILKDLFPDAIKYWINMPH